MNKLKTKHIITSLLLICITCIIGGCAQHHIKYKIGVSQCSSDDWREKMNEEIRREAMFHDDVEVEILSAEDNNDKQIADLQHFVEEGCDIIIVSPREADALTPTIKKIYKSGTPVIIFDRNINGESYTAYQGADNKAIGSSVAQLALRITGNDVRALEIYGLPGSTPAKDRHQGFADEAANNPAITLLGIGYGNWNGTDAAVAADSLLKCHPETNLIYAHNDRMAIAAAEVTDRLGRPDIKIIGVDAAPNIGIRAVADGTIDASFLYPTEGYQLIRTAKAILEGKPFSKNIVYPAVSAVDSSNAEILLMQNNTLKEETSKMEWLKQSVDSYWEQYTTQKTILYGVIIILCLSAVLIFTLMRAYWSHKKHREALDAQNKELERQRNELDSLYKQVTRATQAKTIFFTNVSHDLRTPLTLIAEPVEQLAEAENITYKQRMLMQLANKNVKVLRRLVNQILDFQKYESGKLSVNLTETDVAQTVREWCDSFSNLTIKRHMKLKTELPSSPIMMAVDYDKFESIFLNLMSNAFKYTPDNGTISVSLSASADKIKLTIADNGKGMTKMELEHIFERFYQVDEIHPEGSGIGLTLVKSIVELHGGDIAVDSAPGKGSTFVVTLPITHVEEETAERVSHNSAETITTELSEIETPDNELLKDDTGEDDLPRLLIIDDNADIRRLVEGLLCNNYHILKAANGKEGILRAQKYIPDLIICDVMMPEMDGFETCKHLKSEVATSHIPVLMLTACGADEQRVAGYECGADGYLSKPFNSKVLAARCEALILNHKRVVEALAANSDLHIPSSKEAIKEAPATMANINESLGDIDSDFYNRFVELIETRLSDANVSVEELAEAMGLSRVQFYRKIKALTNYSPVEFLRISRLKHGRTLLQRTDSTIAEVAYKVGFSSPGYFTKCYRDYYGEAPSAVKLK
jgi:signal transduction histidine kinase/DNA-binding response OmpR family regulator/ABC-type xylose transport system substrate-binding protein